MGTQIIHLKDIKSEQFNLVGRKAFDMANLIKLDFSIPKGLCITSVAYDQYVFPLIDQIKRLDLYEDDSDIRILASEIRNTILGISLKQELTHRINQEVEKIGKDKLFVVRNSIIPKQGPDSYSENLPTYLNIPFNQIVHYIIHSWASLFSDQAISNRKKNNIKNVDISMCVIIQEMVSSVKTGVIYTADPANNNQRKVIIQADCGTAERDRYVIDKRGLRIIEKFVSEKNGSNDDQVLANHQISELAKIGLRIEDSYHSSQQIDWIMDKEDHLHILQIKTIPSWFPFPADPDRDYHVYLSFGHIIGNTMPLSPLGRSLVKYLIPFGKRRRKDVPCKYIVEAGGRLYIDISKLMASKKTAKSMIPLLEKMDFYIAEGLAKIYERKIVFKNRKKINRISLTARFLPLLIKTLYITFLKDTINSAETINRYMEEYTQEMRNYILSDDSIIERIERIKEKTSVVFSDLMASICPYILSDIFSRAILKKIFAKHKADESLITKLTRGLRGNLATEMGLMVSDITDLFRERPEFDYILDYVNYEFFKEELESKGDRQFAKTVMDFFEKYDCRGIGDIDIASDRWDEDPSLLFENIKAGIIHCEEGALRKKYAYLENENIAAVLEIEQTFKGQLVHKLANNVLDLSPLRQHPEYLIMQIMKIVKEIFIDAGKTLQKEGCIRDRFDIFYLEINEILESLRTPHSLNDRVVIRKKEDKRYEKLFPPRLLVSEGETVLDNLLNALFEDTACGTGVSPGIVEGRAKVISGPSRKRVRKGEILVIPSIDAAWTPLIMNAAGIVIEVGGQACHIAQVAKELGIPAVVSVDNCTTIFNTGDYIKVDGDNGFVIKLNE